MRAATPPPDRQGAWRAGSIPHKQDLKEQSSGVAQPARLPARPRSCPLFLLLLLVCHILLEDCSPALSLKGNTYLGRALVKYWSNFSRYSIVLVKSSLSFCCLLSTVSCSWHWTSNESSVWRAKKAVASRQAARIRPLNVSGAIFETEAALFLLIDLKEDILIDPIWFGLVCSLVRSVPL